MKQLELTAAGRTAGLPVDFTPRPPEYFQVNRIILTRGSLDTPERARYVRRLCACYPEAAVEEQLDQPHNKVDLGVSALPARHAAGKHTLVFGVLKNAVRFSEEIGNSCPNYWHYSVYGFCPYGCTYCYLAGTQGVWFSPTVKVYVNLEEILGQMDRITRKAEAEISFYHGKLQDGLALDPLTGYSEVLTPWFAQHPRARQILLTKSADVARLLPLAHRGRTTLSWSLNPPEVARRFERNVPSIADRLRAMEQCAAAGYPVRGMIMPMIPVPEWREAYPEFVAELVNRIPLERLTLGGVCNFKQATRLMELKLGRDNVISQHAQAPVEAGDGRRRYPPELCIEMYEAMIAAARAQRPDLEIALCMEDIGLRDYLDVRWGLGRCNCIP